MIEPGKTPEECIANIKKLWAALREENAQLKDRIADLESELRHCRNELCRNELCLRCGNYREKHLGACDGCRWKE